MQIRTGCFPSCERFAAWRRGSSLYELLDVAPESHILDAGCGCGRVALYMASRELYVTAIDVTDRHLERARRNILQLKDLGGRVTVEKMDYHHLEPLAADSFDGVYAMESLCHATNPLQVFQGFLRILRPGGQLVIRDADHPSGDVAMGAEAATMINRISEFGAMPTFQRSKDGLYRELLEEAGFTDVRLYDYSENVKPMLRLFWLLSVVPRFFIKLFGLRNTYSHVDLGWWAYKEQRHWRYVAIAASKHSGYLGRERCCPLATGHRIGRWPLYSTLEAGLVVACLETLASQLIDELYRQGKPHYDQLA
ncbi:hypothetical protein Purlil1_13918 [Purpureocillium lilacinum]|uniref:Methyltransferase type 11 domain-containing protein n=1 Tax=Purpureocillium lilacinum TaxID=33203 RepID=A0ABR0BCR9_PURLI|nr:hypothetical protein Purlil1_13918 [Purpureocillium lilacinum]